MTSTTRSRGYLPHLEAQQAVYFGAFRLADSLPKELVAQLHKQREGLRKASLAGTTTPADLVPLRELRALLERAERCLDRGLGRCHMRNSRIARVVAEAIRHFQGQRYRLLAWCVMPNHVHVLFSPMQGQTLRAILHSWKSYSANQTNALLARTGPFWQREYFDHLVRDESSVLKFMRYIQDNPRRAGLSNWPWVEEGAWSRLRATSTRRRRAAEGQGRGEVAGDEVVEGAEAGGEFGGGQLAVAEERAKKILGAALALLRVALAAAGDEVAVGIVSRLGAGDDVVEAAGARGELGQAIEAQTAFAGMNRLAAGFREQEIRLLEAGGAESAGEAGGHSSVRFGGANLAGQEDFDDVARSGAFDEAQSTLVNKSAYGLASGRG